MASSFRSRKRSVSNASRAAALMMMLMMLMVVVFFCRHYGECDSSYHGEDLSTFSIVMMVVFFFLHTTVIVLTCPLSPSPVPSSPPEYPVVLGQPWHATVITINIIISILITIVIHLITILICITMFIPSYPIVLVLSLF